MDQAALLLQLHATKHKCLINRIDHKLLKGPNKQIVVQGANPIGSGKGGG